jgi:hypothetical protein
MILQIMKKLEYIPTLQIPSWIKIVRPFVEDLVDKIKRAEREGRPITRKIFAGGCVQSGKTMFKVRVTHSGFYAAAGNDDSYRVCVFVCVCVCVCVCVNACVGERHFLKILSFLSQQKLC